MSRAFVLSLHRPHEALGLAMPLSRRFVTGQTRFFVLILGALGVACLVVSIISVNTSASKAYAIRTLEKRAEQLNEQVSYLESQAARMQAYSSLQERVRNLGYVPVTQPKYLEVE